MAFEYSGLRYPLQLDSNGNLAIASTASSVVSGAIQSVLLTFPTERVLRPVYGAASERVFSTPRHTDVVLSEIRAKLFRQVSPTFPGVQFQVSVIFDEAQGTRQVQVLWSLPGDAAPNPPVVLPLYQ